MNLVDSIKAARRVSTPLIAVSTPDQAATLRMLRESFDGEQTKTAAPIPIFRWDAINGLVPLSKPGIAALKSLLGDDESQWAALTSNPMEALVKMALLPGEKRENGSGIVARGSLVFMLNAGRFFEDRNASNDNAVVLQGISNLRDLYKQDRRTLVMLGPAFKFPPELQQDVIAFDEPLPADDVLKVIVQKQAEDTGIKLDDKTVSLAVDGVRGLSAFTVEQITAMSLTKDGIDLNSLWARKIGAIEQTPGLSVDRGEETFDDIGGLNNFKTFGMALLKSERAPRVFVRIDEIEKMFGGLGAAGGPGDNTGVTQDALGVMLREMEVSGFSGIIAVGPPGAGKSLVTKALGNTAAKLTGRKVLTLSADLGATKGGIVGTSETNIRRLMQVIRSVAGKGGAFFVATCNDLTVLPPALRRRFTCGTWFFDLPDEVERKPIWDLNIKKFGLSPKAKRPEDTNWTGAEIRNVCDIAQRLGLSPVVAANYIVPVHRADPDGIERLRRLADGKFLSASKPGVYTRKGANVVVDQSRPIVVDLRGGEV